MFLMQPPEPKWIAPLLQKVVRLTKDVQIVIVSRRDGPGGTHGGAVLNPGLSWYQS